MNKLPTLPQILKSMAILAATIDVTVKIIQFTDLVKEKYSIRVKKKRKAGFR